MGQSIIKQEGVGWGLKVEYEQGITLEILPPVRGQRLRKTGGREIVKDNVFILTGQKMKKS